MNRAQFLTGFASLLVAPLILNKSALAETPITLGWGDLIPGGGEPAQPIILKRHKENAPAAPLPYDNRDDVPIRTDLEGPMPASRAFLSRWPLHLGRTAPAFANFWWPRSSAPASTSRPRLPPKW